MSSSTQRPSFDRSLYRTQYNVGPLLQQTFTYSQYALALLDNLLDDQKHDISSDLPLGIRSELQQIANQVSEGFKHALKLSWSLEEFDEAFKECRDDEEELQRRCPPPPDYPQGTPDQATSHYQPIVFVDKQDRILWAYFPGIIREKRWRDLQHACMPILNPRTESHGETISDGFETFFKPASFSYRPGGLRFYPAAIPSYRFPTIHYSQPSPTFKDPEMRSHALSLLESVNPDTFAIIGAVLALLNPDQFHAAFEIFEGLHTGAIWSGEKSICQDIMERWGLPFTFFDILSNLNFPYHPRSSMRKNVLALYLSMGDASLNSLRVPGLCRMFHFDPGSICVGFPHVFPPSWCSSDDGDQLTFVGSFTEIRFATSRLVRDPKPMGVKEYIAYLDYVIRSQSPPT
ncbi:hypothetical protein CC2G_002205 [Coprinopsis cinerea AmutBmut pab1-1]|nr:hypothetical protein CC2G_002205 [Coprinopsis cinerea AmutBmut pab1-1]